MNITHVGGTPIPCDDGLIVSSASSVVVSDQSADWAETDLREHTELPLGLDVEPGSAVYFGTETDLRGRPGAERSSYWNVPGRPSANATITPAIVVPWADPGVPILRPCGLGHGPIARFLRSVPIPKSRVDVARLPSVIEIPSAAERLPYFEGLFAKFCGELWGDWATDQKTPDLQHPGYGTYLAAVVSQALTLLCSTLPSEMKRPLATRMVQWGIDLAGAFADGRRHYALGGHMAGRKALVILAGHLLAADPIANPNQFVGKAFMEDDAFDPECGWKHSDEAWSRVGEWDLATPWSSATRTAQSYIDQVTGAQIGTALAMHLMGRTASMGQPHFDFCKLWMTGMAGHPIRAAYDRNQMAPAWGTDYSVGGYAGMCADAWRQVNP